MSFEERNQIRQDLIAGKIPKRVPIMPQFSIEAACGLAGIDLKKAHYDFALLEKAYTTVCETFYTDSLPVGNIRYATSYQLLGTKNWVLGSNGAIQHPEIETMMADEYDTFIADPYGFIMETLLPRVCTSLDTDKVNSAINLAKGYQSYTESKAAEMAIYGKLIAKYGYCGGLRAGNLIEAPFDFLADQLRGFKGINMDIRRVPDKVEAACNAVLPLMMKTGIPTKMRPGIINFIPLHLAPYIRTKDFDKLYWPTLEKMVVDLDKLGIACNLFAEQDWTRHADYLARLPESSIFQFEFGDYKLIKEVVGKNHVIGGFFDPTMTLSKSKEECIDAAKRLVDTCAPGGRFYFGLVSAILDIRAIDVPKLQAVFEWVHENAVY